MDKFIQIIEENNLQPEDIERVEAQPHPMVQFKYAQENTLTTQEDYCFDMGYVLACAAHRINPAHWHNLDIRQDPKIQQFMRNIDLDVVIDEKDFALAQLEDSGTYQMRIELVAKGKTFKEKMPYLKGTWEPEEFRNTDEELVKKFTDNASRILPLNKARKTTQIILRLEKLRNVADLMEMVTP